MVVVIILGILAATIIPQFIGTTQDAKVSAAKAQVAELESAVGTILRPHGPLPDDGGGFESARGSAGRRRHHKMARAIHQAASQRSVGQSVSIRFPGTHHPTSFDIWSRGADGADGGEGENADIGNW